MQKDMATSQRQTSLFTEENATCLQEVSLVSRTHSPENDLERTMTDTSGRKCLERFGKFDRNGSWAKMFSELLIGMKGWYSTKCRLTWKLKGTKYRRMYFQLQVSTLPIEGTGFGLLPITMLPTPSAYDCKDGRNPDTFKAAQERHKANGVNLQFPLKQMARNGLLPTPTVMDTNCGDLEKIDQRRERAKSTSKNGNGFRVTIGELANRGLLPTPTTRDFKGGNSIEHLTREEYNKNGKLKDNHINQLPNYVKLHTGKTSQLNPRFVMEMMGFTPNHCDSAFESILMDKLQKIKSTKSFKKRQTNGRKKPSKPEETQ